MGENAGRKKEEVDEDYKQAAALAAMVAPFRHARLSAVKVAGDPNNPARFNDKPPPTNRGYETAGDSDIGRPY
jgi:hypothetical protein